ncbi:MAG: acyl-CoA dehydratase activase-related protein, partial [Fusobacteriaceae bacterium]
KDFPKKAFEYFSKFYKDITLKEIKEATNYGNAMYDKFKLEQKVMTEMALTYAEKNDMKVIVLAGRPYHIDPAINHSIDKLLTSLNCVVVTEDGVAMDSQSENIKVLNQWTYHTRLYDAANFVAKQKNMELVQLVSFGCGLDAITSDEVRAILARSNKLYTQIKIDEISNLGAAKIRLRSLLVASDAKAQ